MNWTWFLFSFKGRFNRAKFWLVIVILAVAGMIYGAIAGIVISAPIVKQAETANEKCAAIKDEAEKQNCINKNMPMFADMQTAQNQCDQLTDSTQISACKEKAMAASMKAVTAGLGKTLLVFLPLYIISFWISLAAYVKRFHDLGKSGWFFLLYIIPLVNFGIFIWQGFIKGTTGPNQYGPDPIQPNTQGAVV